MTIDLAERRAELLRLRENIVRAAGDLAADDEGVGEINTAAGDQHLADHASDLVDLELDQSLGENADNVVAEIDEALARLDAGTYGTAPSAVPRFRRSDWPPSRTRRSAWTTSAARNTVDRVGPPRPAAAPRRSRRLLDERPAAGLERRAPPRGGAGAVGCTARHRRHGDRSRPADEVDRLDAPADRQRGGHDRPIQHSSRQNSGIAFGLFAHSTTAVIVLTRSRSPRCSCSSAAGAASSVAPGRARARDRRQRRQPDRPGAARTRHRLPRLRLWPAFNLADTFIVVGVALLFASFVASDKTSPHLGTAPLSRS